MRPYMMFGRGCSGTAGVAALWPGRPPLPRTCRWVYLYTPPKLVMQAIVERGDIVPETVMAGLSQRDLTTEEMYKLTVATFFRKSSEWVGTSMGYNLRVARGEHIRITGGVICNGS